MTVVSGRLSQARIMAVEMFLGPDHMAMRVVLVVIGEGSLMGLGVFCYAAGVCPWGFVDGGR